LALDFTNTLDWRLRPEPVEELRELSDLLRWGWSSGALERAEARALREWGEAHPGLAARALAQAVEVREAIAEVLLAVLHDQALPAGALDRLDEACLAAGAARSLRPAGQGVEWGWRNGPTSADRVAWTAALDAVRILTSSERERIRQCGDFECGWLFLDTSRNRSRRWCTMKSCGNRNKARSFYRRQVHPDSGS
jgi:predicted RNA-binding Zn ribbon-like protein